MFTAELTSIIISKRKIYIMVTKIASPGIIQAAGEPPKLIEEYIGRLNTETETISIAKMKSPAGWSEPHQTPEFDEYSLVLHGMLHVSSEDGEFDVHAGEAIIVHANTRVQYSTPSDDGAKYIAICIPAFSDDTVHRSE
jgi:mannose-6-phosphate isomerase-like protein (cupin superfamily)